MALDLSSVQEFDAADLLKLVNHAIAHIMAGGQSHMIHGRTFTAASLSELREWRDELKEEVDAASASDGQTIGIARFSRPV